MGSPDDFDPSEVASLVPDRPNVWTDGSLVHDRVTGVSSSGAGFFAHQPGDFWDNRRWGHVDVVRLEGDLPSYVGCPLINQLFDAALGELSVVAPVQPCILVGDCNVEPTKIPCLTKGISAGLWVDLEGSWALATGRRPSSTCLREWGSAGGHRRDFMVGCPLAAAVLSCKVQPGRWIAPHLAVRTLFDCCRWTSQVTQPVLRTPLWPASWLPAVDKSRGSKSVEVQRVWGFMMSAFSSCLFKMLSG